MESKRPRMHHNQMDSRTRSQSAVQDLRHKETLIFKAHCLVCREFYDISPARLKQMSTRRTAKDMASAFNVFAKLVLDEAQMDWCVTWAWDFNIECLPLCSHCARMLFQMEKLKLTLEKMQAELQEKVELVRKQIIQSEEQQNYDNSAVDTRIEAETVPDNDQRVEQFRQLVIQKCKADFKLEHLVSAFDKDESLLFDESPNPPTLDEEEFEEYKEDQDEPDFDETNLSPERWDGIESEDSTDRNLKDVSSLRSSSKDNSKKDGELDSRKSRAAGLLRRFKQRRREREAAIALKSMESNDKLENTTQVRPKRQASLECLRKNQPKRRRPHLKSETSNNSDSEDTALSGSNKSSSESDSGETDGNSDTGDEWVPPDEYFGISVRERRNIEREKRQALNGEVPPKKVRKKPYEKRDGKFYYKEVEFTRVEDTTTFMCSICSLIIKSTSSMMSHINIHKGDYPLICEFCPKGFRSRANLEQHIQIRHSGQVLICDICGKPGRHSRWLENHKYSHMNSEELDAAIQAGAKPPRKPISKQAPGSHQCSQCGKSYKSSQALKDHVAFMHLGRTLACKYENCEEVFKSKNKLKLHLLHFHQELKRNYDCPECQKAHTCASMLKQHLLSSHNIGKKPYQCNVCFKEFAVKGSLRSHAKVHSDFRGFQCDQCEKTYKGQRSLQKHKRKHHS